MGAKMSVDIVSKTFIITEAPVLVDDEYILDFDIKIDLYSDGKEDWKADHRRALARYALPGAQSASIGCLGGRFLSRPPLDPIRVIPCLVHVTQEGGRIVVRAYPPAVEVAPNDAVEWDFRYFGGADVLVTKVIIEIEKPSPFGKSSYRSHKPGNARPHRQVSDLVKERALGSDSVYTIHVLNAFKTELASGSASVMVREPEPVEQI